MKQQLMYIELKTDGLRGEGRIGWVRPSKTGQTLYYQDRVLIKTGGVPLRANFFYQVTLQDFWVSKPKKNGQDALFTTSRAGFHFACILTKQ